MRPVPLHTCLNPSTHCQLVIFMKISSKYIERVAWGCFRKSAIMYFKIYDWIWSWWKPTGRQTDTKVHQAHRSGSGKQPSLGQTAAHIPDGLIPSQPAPARTQLSANCHGDVCVLEGFHGMAGVRAGQQCWAVQSTPVGQTESSRSF